VTSRIYTGEEMTLWEKGNTYIQDAFPNLTGDEREFLKQESI
jgi:hypothetical protein